MITPEMVMEVVTCDPERAESIAAYANRRLAGLLPTDARRETDLSVKIGGSYEKILPALCHRFDLPTPRKAQQRFEFQDARAAGASGGHQTWHVQRGRIDPACPLCATRPTPDTPGPTQELR